MACTNCGFVEQEEEPIFPDSNKDLETNLKVMIDNFITEEEKLDFIKWWDYLYTVFTNSIDDIKNANLVLTMFINSIKDQEIENVEVYINRINKMFAYMRRYTLPHMNLKSLDKIGHYTLKNKNKSVYEILLNNRVDEEKPLDSVF